MKVFYAARVCRFDLVRAIGHLACYLTKWDTTCDRKLHQLMCYVSSTLDCFQYGWVGDRPEDIRLHLYSDADFAGCSTTGRSTSGAFIALEGPKTNFPIAAASKRQSCVSHSTPEAELVAGEYAYRTLGCPAMVMWEILSGQVTYVKNVSTDNAVVPPKDKSATRYLGSWQTQVGVFVGTTLHFHGDNSAMVSVIRSGRNPTMRHLGRTHGVNLRRLHEEALNNKMSLGFIKTHLMRADIFTKFYPNAKADTWQHATKLINVLDKTSFDTLLGSPGQGHVNITSDCPSVTDWDPCGMKPVSCLKLVDHVTAAVIPKRVNLKQYGYLRKRVTLPHYNVPVKNFDPTRGIQSVDISHLSNEVVSLLPEVPQRGIVGPVGQSQEEINRFLRNGSWVFLYFIGKGQAVIEGPDYITRVSHRYPVSIRSSGDVSFQGSGIIVSIECHCPLRP